MCWGGDCSHPGHFGKIGMRWFHLKRNMLHRPSLNLDKLWTLVSDDVREKAAKATDGKAPVIDVTKCVSHDFPF